jgi:nucleotide-binding universal stress UspA family protein
MKNLFRRQQLSDRQESAVRKALQNLKAQRRNRFRVLACIDGSDEGYETVRFAAGLFGEKECDLIILHVRPIDQGLHSGGLQVRLARQNMMDAGFELPGVRYLKQALAVLQEFGIEPQSWSKEAATRDAWGDPAGDTKVEYKSPDGRTVVLKLKTAPDVANGILDQYELGPYNLIIMGQPSKWRGELKAFFDAGVVQQVTTLAPCSVLVVRPGTGKRGAFICTDGTSRSMQAVRRSAVLAHVMSEPITLFCAAATNDGRPAAEEAVANAKALLKAMRIPVHDTKVSVGSAAEEIVEGGSLHRMIVVTDEGRSRLQRLIRGSIATDVVRHARTSVLDVR